MKFIVPAALSAVVAISACTDPYGSSNAQSGAAGGAAIGGIAGAVLNDDNPLAGAVVGAVIGGAIGGAIGTQLDRQEADLRRDLGNRQIRIVNTGSELIVTMPQDILFTTDSAVVRPDLQSDLYVLADSLNDYPGSRIEVIGHTDDVGVAAYNQLLSERRANAVATVLRNGGVSAGRISAFGRGEHEPIAPTVTAAGRAQNRRVEIIIRPKS